MQGLRFCYCPGRKIHLYISIWPWYYWNHGPQEYDISTGASHSETEAAVASQRKNSPPKRRLHVGLRTYRLPCRRDRSRGSDGSKKGGPLSCAHLLSSKPRPTLGLSLSLFICSSSQCGNLTKISFLCFWSIEDGRRNQACTAFRTQPLTLTILVTLPPIRSYFLISAKLWIYQWINSLMRSDSSWESLPQSTTSERCNRDQTQHRRRKKKTKKMGILPGVYIHKPIALLP